MPVQPEAKRAPAPPPRQAKLSTLDRIRSLEWEFEQLVALGVTSRATEPLKEEIEELRAQHRKERPFGARLDSARATLRKAEHHVQAAAERIRKEIDLYNLAEKEAERARLEWQAVQLEAPSIAPEQTAARSLAEAALATLAWLDSHAFGLPGAQPPPDVLL